MPPLGVTLSQEGESLAAVKTSAPPVPELATVTDAGAGFVPPCVVLNERFEFETERMKLELEFELVEPEPEDPAIA